MVDTLREYGLRRTPTDWIEGYQSDPRRSYTIEGCEVELARSFVPPEETALGSAPFRIAILKTHVADTQLDPDLSFSQHCGWVDINARRIGRKAYTPWSAQSHLALNALWSAQPRLANLKRGMRQAYHRPLSKTLSQIKDLIEWDEGWNRYDAAAPNPNAVRRAISWIKEMHDDALTTGGGWQDPHVTADAHGNVVFEWWADQNKLTVYISPEIIEYVQVWGPDIFSDMKDGEIEDSEDRQMLWRWLTDQA